MYWNWRKLLFEKTPTCLLRCAVGSHGIKLGTATQSSRLSIITHRPLYIHYLHHRQLRASAEVAVGLDYFDVCTFFSALLSFLRPRISTPREHPRHRKNVLRYKCSSRHMHICVCHTLLHIACLYWKTFSSARKRFATLARTKTQRHRSCTSILAYWYAIQVCTTTTTAHPSSASPDDNAKCRQRHWSRTTVVMRLSDSWALYWLPLHSIIPTTLLHSTQARNPPQNIAPIL